MTDISQSDSIAALAKALATAQKTIQNVAQNREVEVPIKDKQTGAIKGRYKFSYATLASILTEIRATLTEQGLWYTQFVRDGHMITRLFHESGEWMDTGHLPLPDIKGSPQDIGSIISYFKRYSLSAAIGLATEEDNDGEQADREVSFRARGAAHAQEAVEGGEVEEPPQGWGDWARGLIAVVAEKKTNEELDALRDANKRFINACYRVDRTMHRDIKKAFDNRRAVLNDDLPF
jgi:ERF superfamily